MLEKFCRLERTPQLRLTIPSTVSSPSHSLQTPILVICSLTSLKIDIFDLIIPSNPVDFWGHGSTGSLNRLYYETESKSSSETNRLKQLRELECRLLR